MGYVLPKCTTEFIIHYPKNKIFTAMTIPYKYESVTIISFSIYRLKYKKMGYFNLYPLKYSSICKLKNNFRNKNKLKLYQIAIL